MLDFAGLNPDPCPFCHTREGLRFLRWTPACTHREEFDEDPALHPQTRAAVLFTCSTDSFNTLVPAPDRWRPPFTWVAR